jgi:hypothetical protein
MMKDNIAKDLQAVGENIPYFSMAMAAFQLFRDLFARGQQTGELTPEQSAMLSQTADEFFAAHAQPAPPPPGV